MINGHIHRRLASIQAGQTLLDYARKHQPPRSRSDAARDHVPAVLRVDISPDGYALQHVEIPHRPFDEVFYEAVVSGTSEAGPSAFVAGLAELQSRRTAGGAGLMEFLKQNVGQFEGPVAAEIMNLAKEVTEDVQSENGNQPG